MFDERSTGFAVLPTPLSVPEFDAILFPQKAYAPIGERIWGGASLVLPDELRGQYENVLTGEKFRIEGRIPLAQLLARFPAALLLSA